MLDNLTVNWRRVVALEDVGNQAYLGGVWVYDIAGGGLVEIAQHNRPGSHPVLGGSSPRTRSPPASFQHRSLARLVPA